LFQSEHPQPSVPDAGTQQRVYLLIADNDCGVSVSVHAHRVSAGNQMRQLLSEYSTLGSCGMVPRYSSEQIEACVDAGTASELELPNSDAYWIEHTEIRH